MGKESIGCNFRVKKDGSRFWEDFGEDRATRPCLYVLYGEDIRWLKPHKLTNMGRPYEGFRGRLGRPSVAGALVEKDGRLYRRILVKIGRPVRVYLCYMGKVSVG